MITPTELAEHIASLKAAGVTGPVEIHGIKLTIPHEVEKSDTPVQKRNANKDYDILLFAATEGIPDDGDGS
jgi:hypothetical protein